MAATEEGFAEYLDSMCMRSARHSASHRRSPGERLGEGAGDPRCHPPPDARAPRPRRGSACRELKFRPEELLADVIAQLIGDVRHVAVGNASPIPATAALLARERDGNGRPYVSLLQSRKHNFFTDGARELFDCAGQGRIDVFFLSGGQIDGAGNVNLVSIGDYEHPKVRFPGSFGSAYLYYVVPKVILFRTEHSRRTLVPKVDFISAPGASDAECLSQRRADRAGHQPLPVHFRRTARFTLASVHPGHTVEEVIENTGFDFERPAQVPETPAPSPATLALMREVVAPQLAEVYPQFAAQVFGVGRSAAFATS